MRNPNMSTTRPAIRSITARAVDAPISRPVKNAFGVIRSAPLVLIDVVTDQGLTGAKVRATSPTSIQSGENWWFPRGFAEAIASGASDFIMPDLMKVGGVTGWLRVAAQAEAASIPMSSHLFAEASAHMLAITPTAHWIEYLDLARAIVAEPVEIVDGTITARGHGLGLSWNEAAVAKYLV